MAESVDPKLSSARVPSRWCAAGACATVALMLACGGGDASNASTLADAGDGGSPVDSHSTDECARAMLETAGACELALPDERWVDNLDCHSLILLGACALDCGPPDGWHITDGNRLRLEGAACDLARIESGTPLEVLVPCSPLP